MRAQPRLSAICILKRNNVGYTMCKAVCLCENQKSSKQNMRIMPCLRLIHFRRGPYKTSGQPNSVICNPAWWMEAFARSRAAKTFRAQSCTSQWPCRTLYILAPHPGGCGQVAGWGLKMRPDLRRCPSKHYRHEVGNPFTSAREQKQ